MKAIPIHLFELYLAASLKLKQRYVDGKKDRQQAWQIPYAPPIHVYIHVHGMLYNSWSQNLVFSFFYTGNLK